MVVTTSGTLDISSGAILSLREYCPLPSLGPQEAKAKGPSYAWMLKEIARLVELVGGRKVGVFPLSFELRALIKGEKQPRKGAI
jgi:hypothetical protein